MGEAKRRGTFEQRVSQAEQRRVENMRIRKANQVEERRVIHGLPGNTEARAMPTVHPVIRKPSGLYMAAIAAMISGGKVFIR